MGPMNLDRRNGSWLEGHVDKWVDAGLISAEQGAAISRYEHIGERAAPQRLPLLAEAASYVGSVLALMGGLAAVGPNWDDIGLLGQLAVALGVALVGFVAGTWLVHLAEEGTTRLGSFLWVVGTGGVAMAVVAAMAEIDPRDEAWIPFVVGLPVLVIGLLLWRNHDRPLQLVTAVVGAGTSLGGLTELVDLPETAVGGALVGFGLCFTTAAVFHRIEPRLVGMIVGSFSAWSGGFVLMDLNEHLGLLIALAVAMSVVLIALREGLIALLVLGVIGSLIATEGLLATTFTGAVASLIVTVIGLAIVVVTVLRARRTGQGST